MSEGEQKKSDSRIQIIDALRGLAVILMVIHHFLYDMVEFLDAPSWLFSNPVFNVLHYIFAGIFIGLSGVSSNFSRSNVKRGLKTAAIAIVISVVTYFMDMPIIFGVLHLLAFCMLFYGLTHKLWEKLPKIPMLFITGAFTFLSAWIVNTVEVKSHFLWIFGWDYPGFVSYDYFPLFPWLFVFLFGTYVGYFIKEKKFGEKFYTAKIPVLPAVGRQALIIYVLHQPVLYGLTMLIKYIIK